MLNEESRKYFKRAIALSSSAFSSYALRKENHVQHLQKYSKINEMNDLIEYLKSSNATVLTESYRYDFFGEIRPIWVPTIESPKVVGAFMTEMPAELYRTGRAPAMDVMFSFTSQVSWWHWNCYYFFQFILIVVE